MADSEPNFDFDAQSQNTEKIFWGLLSKKDSKIKNFCKIILYFPVILLILTWFCLEELYESIPIILNYVKSFIKSTHTLLIGIFFSFD